MNKDEMQLENEISLLDLWDRLCEGKIYIFGATFSGILLAFAAILLMSPKFEAVAIVQVGQVNNALVEPATQAIERIKTPAFQIKAAKSIADQDWLEGLMASSGGTTKDLSVQGVKATSNALIELKANASTPEFAVKKLEAVMGELVKFHEELALPTLSKLRDELAIAKEKLLKAEKDLDELSKLVTSASVKDDRFTQLSLMTAVRLQKESEIFGQRQAIMALETALSAPATMPAKAIEAVFVSDRPVSPKKSLLIMLGAIGGLLIGIIWVFILGAWQRAREARQAS